MSLWRSVLPRFKTSFHVVTLSAAAALACSSSDDHEQPETAETTQLIEATWDRPACEAQALAPPPSDPQACNGPWEYTYTEWWTNADSCGAPFCANRPACVSWDLNNPGDGLGFTVQSWTEVVVGGFSYTTTNFGTTGVFPDEVCPDLASNRRSALAATRSGMSQPASNGFTVSWGIVNEIVQEGGDPRDPDWFRTVIYDCGLSINNFPTPITAQRPWCPCAQMVTPECPRSDVHTFTSTDVPKSIPDNNPTGVTSVITVPPGVDIKKVRVSTSIAHTGRGDLEIKVIAPNNQTAVLSNREGGSADDFVASRRDISDSFTRDSSATGNWRLQVRDLASSDVGTIHSFSLEIIESTPTVTSVATLPGQRPPSVPGAPSAGSTRREVVAPLSCSTCDHLPMTTDGEARNKFTCLDTRLATATGNLRSSLAARMKLMFQLAGEKLTSAQRARVEALYDERPEATTACSVAINWDASCLPAANSNQLTAKLQLCDDLRTNGNTSQGAAAAELTTCFSQLTALGAMGNTCRLAMRDSADTTVQTVLARAQPSFAVNFATALPLVLSRIASWWSAATALAANDEAWFIRRSNALTRWLWSTIEAQRMPLPQTPPTTDTQAATLLTDITSTRFANDVSVLTFAFAPGQSTSAPPLLTLTGDALKALSERLMRLAPIHDVGCRFKPCKEGATLMSSAVSELMHALATLPSANAFNDALAAATHLQQQQRAIYDALIQVRDQHAYLTTAWNLLGRPEPFSELVSSSNPPVEAAGLAAIVRDAATAWASYQATGKFKPWTRPRLSSATLRQDDLVGFLTHLIENAAGERAIYVRDRLATVQDLLEQSRSGAASQSRADQLQELRTRTNDIAQRIDAIDLRERNERRALSTFQAEFEAIANSDVLDDNADYQAQTLTPLSASAADRKYPNGGERNVVRDDFAMVQVKVGESLRIHVTGQWAPTCALSHGDIADPTLGTSFPVVVDHALTGPEGYYVTAEGNNYVSRSRTENDTMTASRSVSSCFNGLGGRGSTCIATNYSYQLPGDATTTGGEARISSNFTTGLRLPSTPYARAPVGSLLAVITRKGVTGAPSDPADLDVRVIQRDDVIFAAPPPALPGWPDDEIEVHFVVNDRDENPDGSKCSVTDSSALQIEMTRTTPFGNVAQHIGPGMGDALAALQDAAPAIIAQGELGAADQTSLRSLAWQRLQQALQPLGIGLTGLPPELRQLFDTFVEREIASIARRAQGQALHQQLAQLAIQIDAIVHQQQLAAEHDRLLHLIPRWRLRDLAGNELASSTNALSEALTSHAAPIFELRDPAALTNFRIQVAAQTDQLMNLVITAPYEDAVDDLISFAGAAANAVRDAQFQLPSSQRRTIIIAVPRPPEGLRGPWSGPWRAVSATAANEFWRSAFDAQGTPSGRARITLSPADIYSQPGGGSQVACVDLAPVVRHVGVYFATEGGALILGPAGVEVVVTAATTAPVSFPLVGRAMTFEPDEPTGIAVRAPALNGNTFDVLGDGAGHPNFSVWPAELGAGAGISPFTSFELDMRVFAPPAPVIIRDVLTSSTAMFMVFQVERRTSVNNAWVPGVCPLP